MYNENSHYETVRSITKTMLYFKLMVGVFLVLAGAFIAIQSVTIAVALLMTPDKVPFFELIQKLEPQGIEFISSTGQFTISRTMFSYSVAIILLALISSLGKKILESGINMVKIDIKMMLDEMLEEWREIRQSRREQNGSGSR